MAAQYADESNPVCAVEDIPRKLAALDEHCARLGRDRSQITVTVQTSARTAPTHEQAEREADEAIVRIPQLAARRASLLLRSPQEVAGAYERILATGIDGLTVNLPTNGHVEGRVLLLEQLLAPLIAR